MTLKRMNDLGILLLSSEKDYSIYTKYITNRLSMIDKENVKEKLNKSLVYAKKVENNIFKQAEKRGYNLIEAEKKIKKEIDNAFSINLKSKKESIFTQIQYDAIALKNFANKNQREIRQHKIQLQESLKKIRDGIEEIKKYNSLTFNNMEKLSNTINNAINELNKKDGEVQLRIYELAINLGYYAESMIALKTMEILDKQAKVELIGPQNLKADILVTLEEIIFGISAKAQITLKELKEIETKRQLKLGNITRSMDEIVQKQFKKDIQKIYNEYKIMSYLYWMMGKQSKTYTNQRNEILRISENVNASFSAHAILVALGMTKKDPVIFLQVGNEFYRSSQVIQFLIDNFDTVRAKMTRGYKQDRFILELKNKDSIKNLYDYLSATKGRYQGQNKTFITNYILQKQFTLNKIYLQRT